MTLSWPIFRARCNSPLSTVARCLFRARETWRERARQKEQVIQQLSDKLRQVEREKRNLQNDVEGLKQQNNRLEKKINQANALPTKVVLPPDPPVHGLQFGARFIELSINLARQIGIRRAVRALKLFFQWLDISVRIPSKDSIRGWMQRLGVARIKRVGKLKDAVWLVDDKDGNEDVDDPRHPFAEPLNCLPRLLGHEG